MSRLKCVAMIDGNHMVRRAYHVMENLTDPSGNPTGGIFGFLNSVRTTIGALHPTRLVIFFDGGSDEWRMRLFPGYKDRSEDDPEKEAERRRHAVAVSQQVHELIENVLPYTGIPVLRLQDREADDLIYVAREKAAAPLGLHTIIVSGDRDFYQLIRKDTSVFDPMERKNSKPFEGPPLVTSEGFQKHTGMISPAQFLDYRAIVGDTSDRIPGIKGVGEKTAKDLLAKFGSLRQVFAKKDRVREMGSRFAKIVDNGSIVARNLLLMGLAHRMSREDETVAVKDLILGVAPEIEPEALRKYCKAKRALDFMSNLPELLELLQAQRRRHEGLALDWATKIRELRGSDATRGR